MSSSEMYGPVAVGGVDEVDAELDGALEDLVGALGVLGRAPDAVAGDAHGAIAQAGDLEVAAEAEGGFADCLAHAEVDAGRCAMELHLAVPSARDRDGTLGQ